MPEPLFLIKKNFIKKETLAQVFSCEFYEISKNTVFYRTPQVTASEVYQVFQTDYQEKKEKHYKKRKKNIRKLRSINTLKGNVK